MDAVGSSEPLMHIYGTSRRQSPEVIYWHKYSHENLKTHVNMLQSTQCAFSAYSLVQEGETWGEPTSRWRNTGAKTAECRKGLQQPIFDLLLHAMTAREGVEILSF